MAAILRQVRPDDVTAALALAEAAGAAIEREKLLATCSLLAWDQENAVAGALCVVRSARRDAEIVLCVHPEQGPSDPSAALERRLLDKAMLKLYAAGWHTCHLRLVSGGEGGADPLPGVQWAANVPQPG